MESKDQALIGRIRDFKRARDVDPMSTWALAAPGHGSVETRDAAALYDIPDFLADQRLLLQQGRHDPALASRFSRGRERLLRVPTRQILSALDRPAAAKLFVRRHRSRGWDRFLRFQRAVSFLEDRKDEIVRCGLGVGEQENALVDEEFVAYLLDRPLPTSHAWTTSTPLTIYIRRQRSRAGGPPAEGGPTS